jgi:outer membrane protein assembly factor BamB
MTTLAGSSYPQDWPQWRGPNRDGATSFNTPASWPDSLQQQWQVEVGLGYATPLLVGDRIYMFSRQGDDEVMTALDVDTGETIWRTSYAAPFAMFAATARHEAGPKSTPAYSDGRLFSFGMSSILTAYDADSGEQIWQQPEPAGQPMYHTAMSPVVDGESVIIHIGGAEDSALSAFNVETGDIEWSWDGDSPAYGSPIVAELGGVRQVVAFTNSLLLGLRSDNGTLLWSRPFTTPSNTTSLTPIIHDNMVIQTGRENGLTAFRVIPQGGEWRTEDVWHTDEASLQMTNGVVVDGVMYGLSHLNSGQYFAADMDNGEVLWTSPGRQAENAAIVAAGNTIFSIQDDAEMVVLSASRTEFDAVQRYEIATSETWAQPAISGDRMFVKDVTRLTLWTLD